MMILKEENSINYSIEDIDHAIEDELGFTRIKLNEDGRDGFYILGQDQIKLSVSYRPEGIQVYYEYPDKLIDLSETTSRAEVFITALESALEIVEIIDRMTGGSINEKDN